MHDTGSMDGFGQVGPEPRRPVFHSTWESRGRAMNRAIARAGIWNADMRRAAREVQPAAFYLAASYYESWARRLETLLLDRGLATADEIAAGHALHPAEPLRRPPQRVEDVP